MTLVRTTLWPDKEIEVTDAEHLDLKRQGLLLEDVPAEQQHTDPPAGGKTEKPAGKQGGE